MYIPASTATFLQSVRGSPMGCSSSAAAAEQDQAMFNRLPPFSLRMQMPSKRNSSYYAHKQQQHMMVVSKKTVPATPSVVRKGTGEIVRPCLRKRSNTTASVPDYSEQQRLCSGDRTIAMSHMRAPRFVHFGADLECVRWFLKAQSPQSVCEDAMPDYGFSDSECPCAASPPKKQQQPLTVRLTPLRRPTPSFSTFEDSPVVLERVELADNKRCSAALRGTIKVHNIAFEKAVVVRYSFDQWRSVHEISAEFSHTLVENQGGRPGVDRFVFGMALPESVTENLPTTIAMCVRYNVAGSEHWDNNGGTNFMFKLAPPAIPAIADEDADMDTVPTTRSSSELYAPRRLTFGGQQQQPIAPGLPSFASPTAADTRRYMAQSAAVFGASSYSSSPSAGSRLGAQADGFSSPAAYMHPALCTVQQPELPLYEDMAWCGGDFATASLSSSGASYYGGYSPSFMAGSPASMSRSSSPLAAPLRTVSPIRHAVFDSEGTVRTGSPLSWSRTTTASALHC
ncbi:putative phosphatase regulatory subunit-domain-containing protein [Kickxella alabastrina]|uniref:putative phosphatase regulatory subunit-domain-containing protein n=1 Tax=Kickxella alabastrina TaxID=61397 RepID=UPI00221E410C|nr:putative phosphatase regulatory subunit-domain-containing protein [Kickxella alabastrina]KAI7830841.1 putative phosphatase regulatory subunit-domain-containing protein [Kickxella alabastrina]